MVISKFSKSGIMTLALATLALAPLIARAAEPPGRMDKKQLKTLVANAKTPDDHTRLAAYFSSEAARFRERQAQYEDRAAAELYRDPGPGYGSSGWAHYYGKAAEDAQAQASAHKHMAAIARGDGDTSAQVAEEQRATGASRPSPQSGGMDCSEMMANPTPKAVDMKAMDARLDQKLAAMNGATGDARIGAMAAVINELVSQRKAIWNQISGAQCDMAHHSSAAASPQQESMGECPMMHDMGTPRSKQ
jgi:hypothetical protein